MHPCVIIASTLKSDDPCMDLQCSYEYSKTVRIEPWEVEGRGGYSLLYIDLSLYLYLVMMCGFKANNIASYRLYLTNH